MAKQAIDVPLEKVLKLLVTQARAVLPEGIKVSIVAFGPQTLDLECPQRVLHATVGRREDAVAALERAAQLLRTHADEPRIVVPFPRN